MEGKFYWLKLDKDFFKRHDIKIIEAMPNGKDYIIFYMKLLCESISHDGNLRFSENIPYNENMLSIVTGTNPDVVRSAIKVFSELGMMTILDDGTYYMNEVNKMIGSAANNENANRQRRFRERQKELLLQDCYTSVTKNNESKSKSIEIDIDKEGRFKKPSLEEIKNYCIERKNTVNPESFYNFYESKNWMVGKNKMKDWKACVRTWEQRTTTSIGKREQKQPDWMDKYEKEFEEKMRAKEESQKMTKEEKEEILSHTSELFS